MFVMVAIGLYFYFKTKDLSDYVLGGRGLGPGVTALSAGASDMSGWLLLGLPGMLYSEGIVGSWIAVGLIVGAYLNWHYVAKPLRVYTHHLSDAITIPDYFSNRFEESGNSLRIVTAVVILLFYTLYTSSGLVGGAKLFEATFGLDYDYETNYRDLKRMTAGGEIEGTARRQAGRRSAGRCHHHCRCQSGPAVRTRGPAPAQPLCAAGRHCHGECPAV